MKKASSYILCFFSLLMFAISSCDQNEECNSSTVAGVNFNMVKQSDSTISSFLITPWNSLEDSLFYTGASDLIKTLPLSVVYDSTTFAFITNSNTVDAIVFYHTMTLNFLDEACGYVPKFVIDSMKYSHENLDSIAWTYDQVSTDIENENIKIIY